MFRSRESGIKLTEQRFYGNFISLPDEVKVVESRFPARNRIIHGPAATSILVKILARINGQVHVGQYGMRSFELVYRCCANFFLL